MHVDSLKTLCRIWIKVWHIVTQILCKREKEREKEDSFLFENKAQAVRENGLKLAKRQKSGIIKPQY